MIVWDEKKREINLKKHDLDFAAAYLVYDNPQKVTVSVIRNNEDRNMDVALVSLFDRVLAFVYVVRGEDIRAISLRPASREEREFYAEAHRQD